MIEHLDDVDIVVVHDGLSKEVRAIRKAVYCDEVGWLSPDQVWDQRDNAATVLLAGRQKVWQATVRMLSASMPFEMEEYFDLSEYRREGFCVEIGRLAVLPECRRSLLAIALFRALYRVALRGGVRFFCVAANPANRLYPSLGFQIVRDVINYPPVNAPAVAYVLDLDRAVVEWRQRRPRMLDYFLQPIDGID